MKWAMRVGKCRAFTLVDLTVVLATVALLLMVLPAMTYSHGRPGRAKQIKCTSNLKQIGLGLRGFAQDHDGAYPFFIPNLTNEHTGVALTGNDYDARAWMHFSLLADELNTAKILTCPADNSRIQMTAEDFSTNAAPPGFTNPEHRDAGLSYFIGLPAAEANASMILGGDRNIAAASSMVPYGNGLARKAVNVRTASVWSQSVGHELHSQNGQGRGNLLMADGSVLQSSDKALGDVLSKAAQMHGSNANLFLFPQ